MDLLKLSLLLLAFRQRCARSGKEQVELPRQRLLRADPPLLRGLEADLAAARRLPEELVRNVGPPISTESSQ